MERTDGWVGADIEAICREADQIAVREYVRDSIGGESVSVDDIVLTMDTSSRRSRRSIRTRSVNVRRSKSFQEHRRLTAAFQAVVLSNRSDRDSSVVLE